MSDVEQTETQRLDAAIDLVDERRRERERQKAIADPKFVSASNAGLYRYEGRPGHRYKGAVTEYSANPLAIDPPVPLYTHESVIQLSEGDAWPTVEGERGRVERLALQKIELPAELAVAVPVHEAEQFRAAESFVSAARKLVEDARAGTERRKSVVEKRRQELAEAESQLAEQLKKEASAERHQKAEGAAFDAWVKSSGRSLEALRAAAALNER